MAAQTGEASGRQGIGRRLRWVLTALAGVLLVGLLWFSHTTDPQITGLRNILHYKLVQASGGPRTRSQEPPRMLSGRVQDDNGTPLEGAMILVASPLGEVYTAESDPAGRYRISGVPPGRYVPVAGKRGYGDALEQVCLADLCFKEVVSVRPGKEAPEVNLNLTRLEPPKASVDDSLLISPTVEVEVGAPFPSRSMRTHFRFERAGFEVKDCWLYEPSQGEGPFATLLLVLPGPVLGWEIIPVPFAAEGFAVLACYPLRGTDIDGDVADLLTALEYLRQGRLPSRADTERLGLMAASYSSLHAYRFLALTEQADVALILGGMADGFSFRYDVETGAAKTREPFDQVLMALGFPHLSPEQYFRYSVRYHLEALPPLCLLHGIEDELSPFSQSVDLAEELARRGMLHEFHAYEGLKHYFSTNADNATTQQMFQDALACLRRWLETE
jgi:hypothetical protein